MSIIVVTVMANHALSADRKKQRPLKSAVIFLLVVEMTEEESQIRNTYRYQIVLLRNFVWQLVHHPSVPMKVRHLPLEKLM